MLRVYICVSVRYIITPYGTYTGGRGEEGLYVNKKPSTYTEMCNKPPLCYIYYPVPSTLKEDAGERRAYEERQDALAVQGAAKRAGMRCVVLFIHKIYCVLIII
jgi:hypothetical protein